MAQKTTKMKYLEFSMHVYFFLDLLKMNPKCDQCPELDQIFFQSWIGNRDVNCYLSLFFSLRTELKQSLIIHSSQHREGVY